MTTHRRQPNHNIGAESKRTDCDFSSNVRELLSRSEHSRTAGVQMRWNFMRRIKQRQSAGPRAGRRIFLDLYSKIPPDSTPAIDIPLKSWTYGLGCEYDSGKNEPARQSAHVHFYTHLILVRQMHKLQQLITINSFQFVAMACEPFQVLEAAVVLDVKVRKGIAPRRRFEAILGCKVDVVDK